MSKAFLILADGTVFEGQSIGAKGTSCIGETVFTTGMTGYLETLTDPSYFGQIVTQTFPLIGNYGVIPQDFESKKSWVKGYIVRELCDLPSNFRNEADLDSFLKNQNITGICNIDTRALTKKLREAGVMNGMIVSDDVCPPICDALLSKIKAYRVEKSVETVSCKTLESSDDLSYKKFDDVAKTWPETNHHILQTKKNIHIVLWDFGAKYNIQRELEKRGAHVTVVPYSYTAQDILNLKPDAIMLSNGPGDPSDNTTIICELQKLCEYAKTSSLVIFGICLGHQMLALCQGAKTSKLKYGHRGGNHPVKDLSTSKVYISSQNHGYAVENETLPKNATLSFINTNDNTCEGITYNDMNAFSVQFHPEACGGPHDTNYLFDKFISMIENAKNV